MRTLSREKEREINVAVRRWFKGQGITQDEVARRLGFRNRHAVSTQLANRHFSKNSARRWAAAFGFSERFLLTGEGPLLQHDGADDAENGAGHLHDVIRSLTAANEVLVRKLDEYERLYGPLPR